MAAPGYMLIGAFLLVLLVIYCLYIIARPEKNQSQQQQVTMRVPQRQCCQCQRARQMPEELNFTNIMEESSRRHSAPPPSYDTPPPPYSSVVKEV